MSKQYPGGIISKTAPTPSGAYETSTASGIWTLDQQAYWNKLGQWPTAGNQAPDAQFNYVTMLLHGDGTNGAQNNTFLDSSTNNFTITRNGNTTQGSFSPYGSNWSNYFNGTSTIAFPSNSAFAFGTGAYTVEMWIFITAIGSGGFSHFFNAGNNTGSFGFATATGYSLNVFGYGTGSVITGSSNDITPNQWQHIAVCRSSTSSNDTKIYVNGVLKTTGTDSTNWTVTTTPAVGGITNLSGYSTIGYISNCRVVKGTAVYTAAFTPPTAPLTAISGTSLLTCADNRFVDDSTNNFAITVAGTPSVQRFNPFGTSTAYSTSVIGGSGYFDGSGDYLNVGNPSVNSQLALGSNDFTIQAWVYPLGTGIYTILGSLNNSNGNGSYWLMVNGTFSGGGTIQFGYNYVSGGSGGNDVLFGTGTLPVNAWSFVAVTRSGSNLRGYVNGVQVGTTDTSIGSRTIYPTNQALYVGRNVDSDAYAMNGYLSDVQLVNGTALYTGTTMTVPTAPASAITNTALLCNMTNGAIFDNAMMNDLETVGNAQISTSVVKYGTGSLKFDGTNNCCLTTNSAMSSSGPFTFECWAYWNDTGTSGDMGMLCSQYASGQSGRMLFGSQSGALVLRVDGGTVYLTTSVSTGTWCFVAWTFDGTTHRLFLNGTLASSSTTVPALYTGVNTSIGGQPDSLLADYCLDGYMDEVRITKGVARYTATFTPPTAAFPNIGPT